MRTRHMHTPLVHHTPHIRTHIRTRTHPHTHTHIHVANTCTHRRHEHTHTHAVKQASTVWPSDRLTFWQLDHLTVWWPFDRLTIWPFDRLTAVKLGSNLWSRIQTMAQTKDTSQRLHKLHAAWTRGWLLNARVRDRTLCCTNDKEVLYHWYRELWLKFGVYII